tara:strand:- start:2864 stop:3037 length:174 start_codon:yes stop_codon:yes gene_type:complete
MNTRKQVKATKLDLAKIFIPVIVIATIVLLAATSCASGIHCDAYGENNVELNKEVAK